MYVYNIIYIIDTPIIHLLLFLILLEFGESPQTWVAALLGGEPIRHVFAFLQLWP